MQSHVLVMSVSDTRHVFHYFDIDGGITCKASLVASSFADRVLFVNSGTEANEEALKLATNEAAIVF